MVEIDPSGDTLIVLYDSEPPAVHKPEPGEGAGSDQNDAPNDIQNDSQDGSERIDKDEPEITETEHRPLPSNPLSGST